MVGGRVLRRRGVVTFAFMLLVAELVGRSLTARVDQALHVAPLARASASYYPFLLLAVKIGGALLLAALAARAVRARAAAVAGERLLGERRRSPRLRRGLSPRVWVSAFAGTTLMYLVHIDADGALAGRFSGFSPLLHGYALPVFAVLAVLVAFAWRFTGWLHDVEDYARGTLARARRVLTGVLRRRPAHARPTDDSGPRRRFGLAFESRPPPPLAA